MEIKNLMMQMDSTVLAAVITAIVTFVIFLVTQIWEFVSRILDNRRKVQVVMSSVVAELSLNEKICEMMLRPCKDIRTLGFLFINETWFEVDKSVLFMKGCPGKKIVKVYAKMQQYNLLAKRRDMIQKQKDYPNAEQVIQLERKEMEKIVQDVSKEIKLILDDIEGGLTKQ